MNSRQLLRSSLSIVCALLLGQVLVTPPRPAAAADGDPAGPRRILSGLQIAALVADPVRPQLYAADQTGDSLVVISTLTDTITSRIWLTDQPEDLAITANGSRLYVRLRESARVDVVDLTTLQLSQPISITEPASAFALGGNRLYVNTGIAFPRRLQAYDATSGALVADLDLTAAAVGGAREMVVTPDGTDVVFFGNGSPVFLARFTLNGNTLSLVWSCRSYDGIMGGRGVALSADDSEVYSTLHEGSMGPLKVLGLSACENVTRRLPTADWTRALDVAVAHDRAILGVEKTLAIVRASTGAPLGSLTLPDADQHRRIVLIETAADWRAAYALTSSPFGSGLDEMWVVRPSFAESFIAQPLMALSANERGPITVTVTNTQLWLDQTVFATVTLPSTIGVLTGTLSAGNYDPVRHEVYWSGTPNGAPADLSFRVQASAGFALGTRSEGRLTITGGGQTGAVVREIVVWNPHQIMLPVLQRAP